MEAVMIYIVLALLVGLIIWWSIFGGKLRTRIRKAGKEAGFALDDVIAKGDAAKLGLTLTVQDAQAAFIIVNQVITETKGITPLDANRWHLRYVNPDDLLVVWLVDEAGQGTLRIDEAHEMLGVLNGGQLWKKILKKTAEQLTAAGVSYELKEGLLQKTGRQTESGNAIWSRERES